MTSAVDHLTSDSTDEGGCGGDGSQQSELHSCPHGHCSPVADGYGGHFGAGGSHSGDDCSDEVESDGAGVAVADGAAGVDVDADAVANGGCDVVHSLRPASEL